MSTGGIQRPAEDVSAQFLEWLDERPEDQPFFAFLHFYDPHTPRPQGYDVEVSRVDRAIGEIDRFLRRRQLLDKTHIFWLAITERAWERMAKLRTVFLSTIRRSTCPGLSDQRPGIVSTPPE